MSYLSAGKPIVASIDPRNASAAILNATGAGIVVSPDSSADDFSQAVAKIISNAQLAISMSDASAKYSQDNFDGAKAAEFFIQRIMA